MNWADFYGKHNGETGLIIGNGPSLRNVPLDFLQKYPSFGTNRIYLLEGFTPSYYVSVNPLLLSQFADEIARVSCPKFTAEAYASQVNALPLHSVGVPVFSHQPDEWIYEGYTVTFVAMQIAFYMGFTTILLVGVDHKFTYQGSPNEQRHMAGDDPNHFSKDYFKGANWNNPDLRMSERAYHLARAAYELDGRQIFNLTPETGESVFEKGNINDW